MDRLLIEGIDPGALLAEPIVGIVKELASHWETSTATFLQGPGALAGGA